jgi:hypothetical protein
MALWNSKVAAPTSVGGQTWGDLFNYVEITFSSMAGSTIWLDSLIVGSKSSLTGASVPTPQVRPSSISSPQQWLPTDIWALSSLTATQRR